MSIKDLFGKSSGQIVTQKDVEHLKEDVESVGYVEQRVKDRSQFVPSTVVDFDDPKTFAKYGSARKYYVDAIDRIINTYPYDGSLKEKIEWRNNSTYIDNYFFENEYPRTTGYVLLNNPANHPAGTELDGASDWEYRSGVIRPQYVFFEGGMNPTPNNEDGKLSSEYPEKGNSNIYDPETFRESNLYAVGELGNTIEFWWKREPDTGGITDGSECLFDMWNNVAVGAANYGRIVIEHWDKDWIASDSKPFAYFTYYSDVYGVERQPLGTSLTPTSFDPNEWHHYAFTAVNSGDDLLVKFHVDGELIDEITIADAAIEAIDWIDGNPMTARIGAYQEKPVVAETTPNDFTTNVYGSLQGSIDEFRFWKKARTSKDIGRFWFTQFGGGTNTDEANTSLGVYYKFNEGIVSATEVANVDANVLDYSGRITNALIKNYDLGVRYLESAINEAQNKNDEFRDPIMYSFHPDVASLREQKESEGYAYDITNNASIYNSIPAWITEEEQDNRGDEIVNLIQIMSSYFDTLHLQVESLPQLISTHYIQEGEKPLPFAKRLLDSKGLIAPEIFVDTTVLESLANRTEDRVYEEDVANIKNYIYHNIHNNLAGIYKAKGTEKSFRNIMRCFGIGDKLLKINLYGDGVQFKFDDYYRSASVKKSYINFNNPERFDAWVQQEEDPAISGSVSYVEGSVSGSLSYIPFTMESEVIFPKKTPIDSPFFFATPFTDVSLFGLHNIDASSNDNDWIDHGFSVYARKTKRESSDVRFVLVPHGFGSTTFPALTEGEISIDLPGAGTPITVGLETDIFKEVYDNDKWNFAVRIKPNPLGIVDFVENSTAEYILEFYGVNMIADIVQDEFSVSIELDATEAQEFLNAQKRIYVGAEWKNFGETDAFGNPTSIVTSSDVKVGSTRLWLDYLDDSVIKSHAKDVENYGTKDPYKEAYFSQTSASDVRVPQVDTLLLHWDFETVGSTDGSGEFRVDDISYAYEDDRYSFLSDPAAEGILGRRYTGYGQDFIENDKKTTDKTYISSAKQQLPEVITSNSTINILTQDDDVFTKDSEPFNYFWAIEKSMYQTISDEIVDVFASISSFNNLIGAPVNRYRTEYKDLGKLRQLFFERIDNEPDIEKYIEFYKWIDSAVSQIIQQLIPASANFSEDVRNMIESHILERNKFRNKYQYFAPRKEEDPTPLLGINEMLYNWKRGRATLRENENCLWWKERARKDLAPLATGDENVDEDRQQIHDVYTRVNSGSWESRSLAYGTDTKNMTEYQGQAFALRSLSQPYRFKIDEQPVMKSGTNVYKNKKKDYVKVETQPFSSNTIVVEETSGYANSSCTDGDDLNALKKEKVAFSAANQKYPVGSYENAAKGLLLSPIDLYENITNDQNYWTNLHDDSYGEDKETPIQGPFTYAHVGGSPHRHVPINETDRPEAWQFDGTTFSEPDDLRAKFYRDETAKRPLNIKNIKYDIDDAIYGNYRYDYEIVQTSGRRLNNVWFVKQQGVLPGANASTQSDAVYGHYDFDLPNRGRTEHVFVERFSAPGSSDTLGRGMLDVEAEEYSPYNSLNFRNLNVRTKLNQWSTFHSKFGGNSASCDNPTDQYPCVPSFHKVQRNGREIPSGEGNDFECVEKYDNFWKTEMIPATEYGYSWINDSVDDILAFDNIIGEPSFCRTGYITEKDEMLNTSVYKPPVITDPYISKYGEYYTIEDVADSAGELQFEQGLPFVNNFQTYEGIYLDLDRRPRYRHPKSWDDISFTDTSFTDDLLSEKLPGTILVGLSTQSNLFYKESRKKKPGEASSLNEVINNRGDVFGFSTWKQIRNLEKKHVRAMRRTNLISIEENSKSKEFITEDGRVISFTPAKERLVSNYREPSIAWNKPIKHVLQPRGGSLAARFAHPYSNNLEVFANPFINKRLGIRNSSSQIYDLILDQYIGDNPFGPKFFEMKYEEYIFPKHRNVTLKRTRGRTGYTEFANRGPQGYDRRSSLIRTFWRDDIVKRQRTVYNGLNLNSVALGPFGIQERNSSVWALDYFKYTDPSGETDKTFVQRGDLAWAGYAQYHGYVYEPFTNANIVLWNQEEGNGEIENLNKWVAPRPKLQYIHNPNTQKAREEGWAWNTQLISGNKPWFNSYDAFAVDIKRIGQNYSIVPEFRISEHMDYYVNERGGNFRAENKLMFEMIGNKLRQEKSGDVETSSQLYFSLDGITEIEKYLIEPNCAQFYTNYGIGQILGTDQEELIRLVCPQEPPGDLDSYVRNWRCGTEHPVARFNVFFDSEQNNQCMLTGFRNYPKETIVSFNEYSSSPFDVYTDNDNSITSQSAWEDGGKPAVPIGYAPVPYEEYPTALFDQIVNADKKIYQDQWENSFLVSFWINLNQAEINNNYFDENEMTKSIGCFSIRGANNNTDAPEQVGFYLADHRDVGTKGPSGEPIRYRPYWADTIGNKIYFNMQFGGPSAYAFNQWHHVSILYLGGSQDVDLSQAGYNSKFHRVFLWVNGKQIDSEVWNLNDAVDYSGLGASWSNTQKYNGTLFMGVENGVGAADLGIRQDAKLDYLGDSTQAFSFGKCKSASSFGLAYENIGGESEPMPEALLPGKINDLVWISSGDIDLQPRDNIADCEESVPEAGDALEPSPPSFLSTKWRWLFNNLLPSFLTKNMTSSLVDLLYNSQCEDQNEIFSEWKEEKCETSISIPSLEFVGSGSSNNSSGPTVVITKEGDVKNCPKMLGWWKFGIPRFERQFVESYSWREDFFKFFMHTDPLFHLKKLSNDHRSLGKNSSKVLRLEVDAIKKLLPYNGFYPSQRAVQIGSLFYDSIAPYVEGTNDEQQWERARTEQALLQPFFSPGILFNTIKSGIAVDWAAYSGESTIDGSVITIRDDLLGDIEITSDSSETRGSGNNSNNSIDYINQFGKAGDTNRNKSTPFNNTSTMTAIMERAKNAMSRDVRLGKTTNQNYDTLFRTYYRRALEDTKKAYERLANKTELVATTRDYEIWAEDRELDPYSDVAQEQYRATKIRDVDWRYNPQYAAEFPKGLVSLVDKSYNRGQGNEYREVQTIIVDTIEKINKFPTAEMLTVKYKTETRSKVGGPLQLTDGLDDQATAGNSGPAYGGLLAQCIPDAPNVQGSEDKCITYTDENGCFEFTGKSVAEVQLPESLVAYYEAQGGCYECCNTTPWEEEAGLGGTDDGGGSGSGGAGSGKGGNFPWPGKSPGTGTNPGGGLQPVEDDPPDPAPPPPEEDACAPGFNDIIGQPANQPTDDEVAEEILRENEGRYLDQPSNFRIPFEGLVSLDSVLPLKNSSEPSKIFFLAPSYYTNVSTGTGINDQNRYPYFEWTGKKNVLYELAMNNFLAEIPNFFLKAKKFTTFASKPEKDFKTVEAGKTYYMDVQLYKTDGFDMTISPYDGETVFVNRFGDGLSGPAQTFSDGDGNPYTTQGRYYGPAVRYKTLNSNNEDVFFVGDPAQAPYVPPYFYGRAKARISFTPDFDGKPTLDQILNNVDIEYINEEMDYLFASKSGEDVPSEDEVNNNPFAESEWKGVPAYEGRMPIEASINFFGKTKQRNVLYDVIDSGFQFNPEDETKDSFIANTAEDTVDGSFVWAISPRFECPTLNFNTIENKATRVYEVPQQATFVNPDTGEVTTTGGFVANLEKGENPNSKQYGRDIYGAVERNPRGVGMWSGYGFIPDSDEGIFLTLEESYKRRRTISEPVLPGCEFKGGVPFQTQKVLVAIDKRTSAFVGQDQLVGSNGRYTGGQKITLRDIFGNESPITIGQPTDGGSDFVSKDNPDDATEAAELGIGVVDKIFREDAKIETVLTADGSTINDPYKNLERLFSIEADFDSDNNNSNSDRPKADDIANAICYFTNYQYKNDPNWAWKATIRWVDEELKQSSEGLAQYADSTGIYNFSDNILFGYGAIVEFEWAPKIDNPIYIGQEQINETCQVDLSPLGDEVGLLIRYVKENLNVNETLFPQSSGAALTGQYRQRFFLSQSETCDDIGSLIDVCGFNSSRSRIGDISDEKEISEALVMIPFIDTPDTSPGLAPTVEVMGRNFFKISKKLFNFTKANVVAGKPAIPQGLTYDVEEDIEDTSVSDMIKKMQRYNIPPMLDFITYPLKAGEFPFVMYIFEFTETLDKNDLSNIWQGLMPNISKKASKQTQIIEHEMNRVNFFEGKELPENVRWMVFRVKRKANINYFKVTADSQDDDRFKFNFDVGIKEPEYSYNWPYDFCSLVELARIRGGVSILPPETTVQKELKEPIKKNKLEDLIDTAASTEQDTPFSKTKDNIFDIEDKK